MDWTLVEKKSLEGHVGVFYNEEGGVKISVKDGTYNLGRAQALQFRKAVNEAVAASRKAHRKGSY